MPLENLQVKNQSSLQLVLLIHSINFVPNKIIICKITGCLIKLNVLIKQKSKDTT